MSLVEFVNTNTNTLISAASAKHEDHSMTLNLNLKPCHSNCTKLEDDDFFDDDIRDILENGIKRQYKHEDLILEIICFKLSCNKSLADTLRISFVVILENFLTTYPMKHASITNLLKADDLVQHLANWKLLFQKLIPGKDHELEALAILEDICVSSVAFTSIFHVIVQYLNQEEIISDQSMKVWSELEEVGYNTSDCYVYICEEDHKGFVEKMNPYFRTIF